MTKASEHYSDCATHNMPAYPNGQCDCGSTKSKASELADEMQRYGVVTMNRWATDGSALLRQQEAVIRQMLEAMDDLLLDIADSNPMMGYDDHDSDAVKLSIVAIKAAKEVLK